MRFPIKTPDEEIKRLYLDEKMSVDKISSRLGVSKVTTWRRLKSMGINRSQSVANDMSNTLNPNLAPSVDIAYIIGVIWGDGYISRFLVKSELKYKHIVGLNTTEKVFAESFSKSLETIGLHPATDFYFGDNGVSKLPQHRVHAFSKRFYFWAKSLTHQSVKTEYLKTVDMKASFLRGFYESEGSFEISKRRGYPSVSLSNTNMGLLELVRKLMAELGLRATRLRVHPNHGFGKETKPLGRINLHGIQAVRLMDLCNPVIKLPPKDFEYVDKSNNMSRSFKKSHGNSMSC